MSMEAEEMDSSNPNVDPPPVAHDQLAEIQAEFLSPKEFAPRHDLSISTVRRYVKDGRIPADQPGGRRHRILIPIDALTQSGKASKTPSDATTDAASREKPSVPREIHKRSGPMPKWLQKNNNQ